MSDTIPDALRAAAAAYGDRPAYVDGDRTLTHAQLHALVRRTAAGYLAAGVKTGDRILVWAPNSLDWAVAALAISYAGGTLVPANSRYTAHEVATLIERTSARLVLVADGFLGGTQIADLRGASPLESVAEVLDIAALDELRSRGDAVDPAAVEARADAVSPDDVADIMFTSGTTGQPKGAMTAHRQTLGVARVWGRLGGITAEDQYLVIAPFFHTFGYKVGILVGLLTGCTLHPAPTYDPVGMMQLIQDARITVLPGAPAIYQGLLDSPERGRFDLSSLRLAVTGATMVPVVLIERMRADAPAGLAIDQVVTAFGQTEAVVVTMCRKEDTAETVAHTCGSPVPGMEIRLGEQDELLVRGDYVMLGYLDDPEATAAAIDEDGWLHTGDVATIDRAGNLTITDRLKDMYISGGFNVYPAEVEQQLLRHDRIADAAVIGVPDDRMGEVGKAFVVRRDPALTADEVIAFASERLAKFKVPRQVEFRDALPRNLSGKVQKVDLS
ncbi:FadD3 family acyl-CoA ligase [Nocardioides terrisoli]|uniref:FadD3 family acyl-CoA ligase n=1 Tax=Nocardioides terrisoli TaxID=3388267 RepID=UPI00287B9009|nr:FadD3 family acyl-CoA ligase [Nocardioides marmorisolisilvae]